MAERCENMQRERIQGVDTPASILTRRLRFAGGIRRPLRLLRKEKFNDLREADRGPRLIAGGNWQG